MKNVLKMLNITELTCRVCLQEQEVLINVYDELEDLNTNLCQLLETCAELKIYEDDPFPKYLCEVCTRELLITSKFRRKCDKSKETLSEMFQTLNIADFEEVSNSSDIIEYCLEEGDEVEVSDLKAQESTTHEEHAQMDHIQPIDLVCQSSLLKKTPVETNKSSGLSNQSRIKTVTEEATENSIHLETVETEETTDVRGDSAPIILEEFSINHLFTKKQSPKFINIFKCDVCGALFKQAMNLQKHLQKSHETDHCFICSNCSHCFSLETEFYKHVENCTFVKNTEKNAVNKMFDAENGLNAALQTESTRKCIYCERTFSTPFALRMHLRTHTGERPYQCNYCTKSFKTQSQLNVHHKRHIGQADFLCTICNKSFYEQSNLSAHMRSHTGERPHVCSICNKTFARVFLLQFHMRTHTGEKPFKCSFCEKNFRQHTDLRNHLTIHTGKKQHICILCGKSYIKRTHLVQHMSKHQVHSNATETEQISNLEQDPNFLQNFQVSYSLNDIIESEDVVTHADNF